MPALEQVRDPNSTAGLSRNRANTIQYARANDDEAGSDMIENDQIKPGPSASSAVRRSYGTMPLRTRKLPNQVSHGRSFSLWGFQGLHRVQSNPSAILRSPSSIISFGKLSRPISTYDDPHVKGAAEADADADAKVNGIRVWYSSFTSIDWLHDTIKDSLRFSMLRKRKSLRGRLWLTFDKSLGWIIVTIVGFLTAVVAFLIVRTEQLLFDAKEGYCTSSWWSAKRFCCPRFDDEELTVTRGDRLFKEMCPAWRTWADVLSRDQVANQNGAIEFVSYTCIAVSVTCLSVAVNNTDASQRYSLQ
jgi:chloride channel 3/4/5